MPLILAIETATRLCSVALARDGAVLAIREEESDRHAHAELLNVFIQQVMEAAGCTLFQLDAVAVGIGPGSYTGLRIGLSAAKGLCYALEKPLIGLNTLGTLTQTALDADVHGDELWPMIDARRMEVFTQKYDRRGRAQDMVTPLILEGNWIEGSKQRAVFGDGADKASMLWQGRGTIHFLPGIRPHAAAMIPEAERRYAAKAFDDLAYLVPEYGKAANVTQPKKQPR